MAEIRTLRPQAGPQTAFLSTPADIAITGGGNFGGKTFSLLLDPLRHIGNEGFEAVFFRRESPQITNPDGLWDEALRMYAGAKARTSPRHEIEFQSGARCTFSHMQQEADKYDWDGAQITGIYFDQLESFTEGQFWYMLSRNRSLCGIRPYIRATCNTSPNSWLSQLLQWWWDAETGYPIPERSGVLRWFVRDGDTMRWAESAQELVERYPATVPKSFTYISSTALDNRIGLELDPSVISSLMNLGRVEMERRLKSNWKIVEIKGDGLFKPEWWKVLTPEVWNAIKENPTQNFRWARGWDPAGGQSKGSDYSSGALVGHAKDPNDKRIIIGNITRGQWSPKVRNDMMVATARADEKFEPFNCFWKSRTPDMNASIREDTDGFGFWSITERGKKWYRAQRIAVQAEAGNVYLAPGDWNADFIMEAAQFTEGDSDEIRKDDQIDSVCLADSQLMRM